MAVPAMAWGLFVMSAPGSDLFQLDPALFRVALGEALRDRRHELGLTQSALAARLDVHQSRIWEWENGRHVLRWDRLLLVCGALRMTPTEMVARAETRTRDLMHAAERPERTMAD